MSLVGAISVTVASICYLVALCMFFNPDARIKALRVASFCMLVFFLASVASMIIRWFQVLSNRGKLGEKNYYHKKRTRFRIALIILGVLCTLFVLVSGAGIFLFAKGFSKVTDNVLDGSNQMFSRRNDTGATNATSPSNTTTANSTDSESGRIREKSKPRKLPEPSSGAGGRGRGKNKNSESGPDETSTDDTLSGDGGHATSSTELKEHRKREKPLRCRKGKCDSEVGTDDGTEDGTEESQTTEPIPEDKQHCRNRTAYPNRKARKDCRIAGLEAKVTGFVNEKYVMAAFLGLSFIGHLINVCVALCCNGDPVDPEEDGYKQPDNESDEGANI